MYCSAILSSCGQCSLAGTTLNHSNVQSTSNHFCKSCFPLSKRMLFETLYDTAHFTTTTMSAFGVVIFDTKTTRASLEKRFFIATINRTFCIFYMSSPRMPVVTKWNGPYRRINFNSYWWFSDDQFLSNPMIAIKEQEVEDGFGTTVAQVRQRMLKITRRLPHGVAVAYVKIASE